MVCNCLQHKGYDSLDCSTGVRAHAEPEPLQEQRFMGELCLKNIKTAKYHALMTEINEIAKKSNRFIRLILNKSVYNRFIEILFQKIVTL